MIDANIVIVDYRAGVKTKFSPGEYCPKPIATAKVRLPREVDGLMERLAENAHDVWARQRMAEGWTYGPRRHDVKKEHPCLVPYHKLPESEKEYDRRTAMESIKAILAFGYKIQKRTRPGKS